MLCGFVTVSLLQTSLLWFLSVLWKMTSYLHWVFVWGMRRENDITMLLTFYICLRKQTNFCANISYTKCVALVLFIFLAVHCLHQTRTEAYLISLNRAKGPQQGLGKKKKKNKIQCNVNTSVNWTFAWSPWKNARRNFQAN